MNKKELAAKVAAQTGMLPKDAAAAVDAVFEVIQGTLAAGDKVSISGFGAFETANRQARTGRNPHTGESIQIAASRSPKFKAGKNLKEAVAI